MTKAKELRDMSDEQLALTLKDAVEHLFRLRVRSHTERTSGSSEKRLYRRLIARIKTIQSERPSQTVSGAA